MALFVPDASATLTWFFEDETTNWTEALLARLRLGDEAIVPKHWPVEVANAFLMAIRRGRLAEENAARFFEDLLALPIRVDTVGYDNTFGRVFRLAERYGLTVYDAAYLELAIREGISLATLDDELRSAARAAGVPLAHEA